MLNLKKLEAILVNYYFLFMIVAYFLNVFVNFRPAYFLLILNVVLIFLRIINVVVTKKIHCNLVLAFCIWLALSCLLSVIVSSNVSIPLNSFLYLMTPCVLFFSLSNEAVNIKKVYSTLLYAILFNEVIGTFYFYTKPAFFAHYLQRVNTSSYDQLMHHAGLGRLVTMFGSIETAQYAVIAIVICLGFLSRKNGSKRLGVIGLTISGIVLILTQQRGPLFALVIGVAFLVVCANREKLVKPITILLFIFIFSSAMYGLYLYKPTIFKWMVERITNPSSAVNERYDYQWQVLVDNLNLLEWFTGKGIGNFGFFVEISTRATRIFDQLYFNMIGEVGFIGAAIFIGIIIKCFSSFRKNMKQFFVPMFIIFEVAFVGLGTTLIYYPQIMPIFWFSVGVILKSRYFYID